MFWGCAPAPPPRPLSLPLGDYSYAKAYGTWLIGDSLKHQRFVFRELAGRTVFQLLVDTAIVSNGERIEGAPLAETWKQRLGHYEVTNPGAFPWFKVASLEYDESTNLLRAFLSGNGTFSPDFALRPISDAEAVVLGLGPGAGEIFQIKNVNGEEHLRYSGYEFRQVP